MIGEDIEYISEGNEKPYGGAFKVTSDLSKIYHDKVMNTPISEGLIAGFVNGFSILGGIAIGEIMFGDFMTLTLDQILQHASKFKNMFGDEIPLRGVIRSPMGGRRGYGPTHSQSLHGHFLGIEGVNLYATNYRLNHEKFYASLPETNSYSIVFEDKVDYGLKPKENNLQYNEITGKGIIGKLQNEKSRIGIVGYGGFLKNIEDLVEEIYSEDKFAIDILWLVKLNRLILSDYNNFLTNKDILIFIDEGSKEGNVGQSFISGLTQHNNQNTLKIHHLSNDSTIPASSELEQVLLDFKKKIKSILWMSKE
jgi:2-oxoisovalerate dehydrogenase E1 component